MIHKPFFVPHLLSSLLSQLGKKYDINSKFANVNYMPKAFDAFYWYTKFTTDPNDDGLDTQYDGNNGDIISPVIICLVH